MSKNFPTKEWSDRQCRDKYINSLQIIDESIEKKDWTNEEINLL
jgi:hypothetical protein